MIRLPKASPISVVSLAILIACVAPAISADDDLLTVRERTYATRTEVSSGATLAAVLETIRRGRSKWVKVSGKLSPYSGKFPKGKGLMELEIGSQTILVHPFAMHKDQIKAFSNRTISAHVEISHFPMPDNPATQLQGHWITEIKGLKVRDVPE
jgi:hypothetical protein